MPELVAAHLILALYWTHQMDSTKITRYIGLAHQSNIIMNDSPGPLAAALTFVSVILYDAKVWWYQGESSGWVGRWVGGNDRSSMPLDILLRRQRRVAGGAVGGRACLPLSLSRIWLFVAVSLRGLGAPAQL